MSGTEFEEWIEVQLKKHGLDVARNSKSSGDHGTDLICINDKGVQIGIQAKRWKGNVGLKAVQEVLAGRYIHKYSHCAVITQSGFTPAAIRLAKAAKVILIDGNKLMQMHTVLQRIEVND